MEQIIEQLIKLNKKDVWDVLGTVVPTLISIVMVLQSNQISKLENKLQKSVHNRDEVNCYRDEIMRIYNIYYEFCDCILETGFARCVREGNVNMAWSWMNNLSTLRKIVGRTDNLAKILFKKKDKGLYDVVHKRFDLAMRIIEMYMNYISSGKMLSVSENAWDVICMNNTVVKYNYQRLTPKQYDDFMKLCASEDIQKIDEKLKEYEELHSYEQFDVHFERYISIHEME